MLNWLRDIALRASDKAPVAEGPFYLVIDVETNGLPVNHRASYTDLDNWPRMIQLAWGLYDGQGHRIARNLYLVLPRRFTIPEKAVHGITQAQAERHGLPVKEVLQPLVEAVLSYQPVLVGHNIHFDYHVVAAELYRLGAEAPLVRLPTICTMRSSTTYCRLPSKNPGKYKWPSLDELYFTLFGTHQAGRHDAAEDVDACARAFFRLVELGVIDLRNNDTGVRA